MFCSDKVTDIVVENTNVHSTLKSGLSANTSRSEIEQCIGMHIKIGVIGLLAYTHYWSNALLSKFSNNAANKLSDVTQIFPLC